MEGSHSYLDFITNGDACELDYILDVLSIRKQELPDKIKNLFNAIIESDTKKKLQHAIKKVEYFINTDDDSHKAIFYDFLEFFEEIQQGLISSQ